MCSALIASGIRLPITDNTPSPTATTQPNLRAFIEDARRAIASHSIEQHRVSAQISTDSGERSPEGHLIVNNSNDPDPLIRPSVHEAVDAIYSITVSN